MRWESLWTLLVVLMVSRPALAGTNLWRKRVAAPSCRHRGWTRWSVHCRSYRERSSPI